MNFRSLGLCTQSCWLLHSGYATDGRVRDVGEDVLLRARPALRCYIITDFLTRYVDPTDRVLSGENRTLHLYHY
ncbi:hypothetical protein J6590_001052 [Homalodisca vitripennis]|nr:hypothetical protein J6590_001052 [Homalodisca vitripennis]